MTDDELIRAMDDIRKLAKLGHAARAQAGIPVRQPLSVIYCVVPVTPPEKK